MGKFDKTATGEWKVPTGAQHGLRRNRSTAGLNSSCARCCGVLQGMLKEGLQRQSKTAKVQCLGGLNTIQHALPAYFFSAALRRGTATGPPKQLTTGTRKD